MQLLYFLFDEKNTLPGTYYNLPEGEKVVIRALFEYTMEQRIKNQKT